MRKEPILDNGFDFFFCTLVIGDINYITCSVNLIKSIRKFFPCERIVVLTDKETCPKLETVYKYYKLLDCNIKLRICKPIKFSVDGMKTQSKTWHNTYNKLNFYRIPEVKEERYKHVVYMDCDYIMRKHFAFTTLPTLSNRFLHTNTKMLIMDRYSFEEINFYTNESDNEVYEGAGGCIITNVQDDLSEEIIKLGMKAKVKWEGEEFLIYNYYRKHFHVYCHEFLLTHDFWEMNGNCNDDNKNFECNFHYWGKPLYSNGLVYSLLAIRNRHQKRKIKKLLKES